MLKSVVQLLLTPTEERYIKQHWGENMNAGIRDILYAAASRLHGKPGKAPPIPGRDAKPEVYVGGCRQVKVHLYPLEVNYLQLVWASHPRAALRLVMQYAAQELHGLDISYDKGDNT